MDAGLKAIEAEQREREGVGWRRLSCLSIGSAHDVDGSLFAFALVFFLLSWLANFANAVLT
jgi:hypothetical protein